MARERTGRRLRLPAGHRGGGPRRPRPGAPRRPCPAPRTPGRRHRGVVRPARRGVPHPTSRLRARPRRRRLSLPDGWRSARLCRALPAQRPACQVVGRGLGNVGDRRLQAADLAVADRLDPRRRSRRGPAYAAVSWLHRRCRPRPWARPSRACSAPRPSSWSGWASIRPPTSLRSPSSSPTPTWSRRWRRVSASSADSQVETIG